MDEKTQNIVHDNREVIIDMIVDMYDLFSTNIWEIGTKISKRD